MIHRWQVRYSSGGAVGFSRGRFACALATAAVAGSAVQTRAKHGDDTEDVVGDLAFRSRIQIGSTNRTRLYAKGPNRFRYEKTT
jgi:hypothetical protein